jgi:ribosomal protein S18 acetylase RimI-like enzyme
VSLAIRHAQPSDYGRVIQHVNAWWGGRDMAPMLPKLFFLHFEGTSFVAEDDEGALVAFLIGFLSQTAADEAYIHFVGVAPGQRGSGIGRELYERFFAVAKEHGRTVVRCVTSPANGESVAFHEALGFVVDRVARDYDGPGADRVLFVKSLDV